MRQVYNQKDLSITIDGVPIRGFGEGTSITFTFDGGEVQKTQGTDGPAVNIATNQGATVQFTLREGSPSLQFCVDLRTRQDAGGPGVTVIATSGTGILMTLVDGYISRPGELSTGDKMQGGMTFTITSANDALSNLTPEGTTLRGLAAAGASVLANI